MSAATIPLMYHSPEIPDAVQSYGKMLSLQAMQRQAAQEQQMNPLLLQEAQLKVQQAQNTQSTNQDIQTATQKWNADHPAGGAAPVTTTAAPSTAGTQPLSTVATAPAANADNPSRDMSDYEGSSNLGSLQASTLPSYTPPAAGTATAPAPTAGGAPASKPGAPSDTLEDYIAREMTANGRGSLAPAVLQNRAIAKMDQIKAADAVRQDNDQNFWGKALQNNPGNPEAALDEAIKNGMSPAGAANMRTQLQGVAQKQAEVIKARTQGEQEAVNLQKSKNDNLATAAQSFLDSHPDDKDDPNGMQQKWQDFLTGQWKAKNIGNDDYQAAQRQPFPGAAGIKSMIGQHASQTWRENQGKIELAKQVQNIQTLANAASQGMAAYTKAIQTTGVDPSTLPAQFNDDGSPIPGAVAQLNRMAMTPEQKIVADGLATSRAQTAAHEKEMELLMQQRINDKPERAETATEHKARISQLADQAQRFSAQGAKANGGTGGTPAQALADVNNQDLYNDGDGAKIGDNRGEVAAELQRRIDNPAKNAAALANINARTQKLNEGGGSGVNPMQAIKNQSLYLKQFGKLPVDASGKVDDDAIAKRLGGQAATGGRSNGAGTQKLATEAKPAAAGTPANQKPANQAGGTFSLHLPPELAAKFGGKQVVTFSGKDAAEAEANANKFAAAAGLTVQK